VNHQTDSQLLRAYAEHHTEPAFAELVRRHVDLVHSAALRMVRDSHLAQDVTQGVFVALAKNAAQLTDRPVLSGWLHRTAQNIAAQTVRTDVRRRAREQEAAAMNELLADQPEAVWEHVAPLLDAALGELSEPDRDALLLRYFEHKSAREMAETLGVSDEAAQKRVSRAVERLREFFARHGVSVGASGLVVSLTANAVQAAPVGLAVTISAAALAGSTIATTATVTAATATTIETIAMTTLQKILVTTALVAAAGVALYEARQVSSLRQQNQSLQQQQAPLAGQIEKLQTERDTAAKRLANATEELATVKQRPTEVFKLRSQVGMLRQEKDAIVSKSALSKITADPETRKMIREQQKMGMSAIYGDLTKRMKLTPELKGQFDDLLADQIMDGIDVITQALHDKKSSAEIDQLFAAQDVALQEKLAALIGPDGLAQYLDYSKDLASTLTVEQFKGSLTGDKKAKADKQKQLLQAVQEESRSAVATAGLPADFQTVPMLNFRNIASEEFGERSLKLLDGVYERVATRASAFLSEEEIKKFQEFWKTALEQNRAGLVMNRKLMAPLAQ
jgi:RNA polymerase sigma factor (sigma-70 family)